MSRYSRVDSDDERLAEGMERVGYDADTQTYSYRDQDGSYWEGDPGARYGVLHRSGTTSQPMTMAEEETLRRSDKEAWRYLLPFFLLVSVVLFALFRFLNSGSFTKVLFCEEGSVPYMVEPGDSCWDTANDRGVTVADLMNLNLDLECSPLKAGKEICVPGSK